MGCTPFLTLTVQKIHCVFRPTFVDSKKIGANNAPKKLPSAIFACPSFANKMTSAALKSSAKMVFARRTNQRAICPRTAQTKKREIITPSLSHLINLITVFIAFHSNCLLFAFEPQQAMMSIWS